MERAAGMSKRSPMNRIKDGLIPHPVSHVECREARVRYYVYGDYLHE